MSNYTIFGTGAPSGMSYDGATIDALDLFTAFYITSGTNLKVTGARVWLDPTGDNNTGYKAYLWQGKDITSATPIASADFPAPMALGGWNTATFASPVQISVGNYYWVSVHFPHGRYSYKANTFGSALASVDLAGLYGAGFSEVTPGNGAYNLSGTAGAPPTGTAGNNPWYGVDVVISDAGPSGVTPADTAAFTDAITAVRGGLPTELTAQGTATDPIGVAATDSPTVPIGSGASTQHAFEVSMMGNRIYMGSPIGRELGPTLSTTADQPAEVGVEFQVKRSVKITGARIYKHPQAAGSIPVTLWDESGNALATTTVDWVADGGGYRRVMFDTPVPMAPGSKYRFSYFAANGFFPANNWYYNAQEMYEPPFWVGDPSVGPAASVFNYGSHAFPTTRGSATGYWIDVLGTLDLDLPAAADGFMGQWSNYKPKNAFPVGVYYPDPEWLSDYFDVGVRTLINIPIGVTGYREAILAAGGFDVWPGGDPSWVVSDPELAEYVVGYVLGDEPDMYPSWVDAQTLRSWVTNIRSQDSSRPIFLNFGTAAALTATWAFLTPGLTLTEHMTRVLDQIGIADIVSCDYYNLEPKTSNGYGGIWTYFAQVRRMRQFSDGLKPVWAIVETTSQEPGFPLPGDVEKAVWAALIAGAKGIIFFDHRFPDALNTMDFAALLHDPDMRAKVSAISAQLQSLAPALLADEAGLVTSVSSSNTTAGPLGGTYGVPIEVSTRQAGGKSYLFAMAARPGTTTGTFVVPSAAGKTLTRIGPGESGTVTVDASGSFVQPFTSDYEIHLFEWVA